MRPFGWNHLVHNDYDCHCYCNVIYSLDNSDRCTLSLLLHVLVALEVRLLNQTGGRETSRRLDVLARRQSIQIIKKIQVEYSVSKNYVADLCL